MNYRLVHNNTDILALVEAEGVTSSIYTIFEGNLAQVRAEVLRLNLQDPQGLIPISMPIELSKLAIRRKLRELGLEATFNTLLASIPNAQSDWNDAEVIMSNDPLFTTYAQQFQTALGLTDIQFDAFMTSIATQQ